MALKQTITTATVQLKREIAWATQRVRLLASLAGVPRSVARELGKATQELLNQLRAHGAPITINFVLLHADDQQALEIELQQRLDPAADKCDFDEMKRLLAAIDEGLRPVECDVTAVLPEVNDECELRDVTIGLRRALAAEDHVTPEVANQWSTVLASGSADSALAESQRRLARLATSLVSANERGARLEQELASVNKLNETLELLALVASKTDNGVAILNQQGLIEWVNDSFQRLTGQQLTAVMGKPLPEAIFADAVGDHVEPDSTSLVDAFGEFSDALRDGVALQQNVTRAGFKRGLPLSGERTQSAGTDSPPKGQPPFETGSSALPSASGREEQIWLSVNTTPVFDDQGTVTRWIAMVRDVTQERLHQEQLSQAKQRAEHASRVKGDFLANISHEIRTPMNAIVGMIDLLLDSQLDSRQQEYAGIAREASGTLLQLLNDVLDLSKIESGQLNIHEVEFSLRETVKSAIGPFRANALQAGIGLENEIGANVPDQLIGDPVRLRQILMNLISNAVKFTEQGIVKLHVSSLAEIETTTTLRFAVSDTGIGIPPEHLEAVFQPFEQLGKDPVGQGTGLGLAICRQLAGLLGATLRAESVPGQGSRFILEAPFGMVSDTNATDAVTSMPLAEVKTYTDNSEALRILVADDHPANRLLLRRILEKCNHIVHEASDGFEALQLASEHEFQLALLDIRMPNMDGTTASKKLRELYLQRSLAAPPMFAITAHASPEDKQRFLADGFDDYLPKPFSAQELLAKIATLKRSPGGIAADSDQDESHVGYTQPLHRGYDPDPNSSATGQFSAALRRLENDHEMLREQMQLFLEDAPQLFSQLMEATARGPSSKVEQLAHRLKALARSFDAHRLAAQLQTIEHAAHQQDLTSARDQTQSAANELKALVSAIRKSLADVST